MSLAEKIREKAKTLSELAQLHNRTIKDAPGATFEERYKKATEPVLKQKWVKVDDVLAITEKMEKQNLDLFERFEKISDHKDEQIKKLEEERIDEILNNLPKRASRRDVEIARVKISLIFEGKAVVDKQVLCELAELWNTRPKLFDYYKSSDPNYAAVRTSIKEFFKTFGKKVAELTGENLKNDV